MKGDKQRYEKRGNQVGEQREANREIRGGRQRHKKIGQRNEKRKECAERRKVRTDR